MVVCGEYVKGEIYCCCGSVPVAVTTYADYMFLLTTWQTHLTLSVLCMMLVRWLNLCVWRLVVDIVFVAFMMSLGRLCTCVSECVRVSVIFGLLNRLRRQALNMPL